MGKTWEEAAAGMVVAVDEVTAVMNESHSIFLLASNTIGLRREIGSKKKKKGKKERNPRKYTEEEVTCINIISKHFV